MNQVIDFSTLTWVKKELDETLKEARQALEAHVENPRDEAPIKVLVAHLHQVYGTLQMVELYGASLLAEEMEQVAMTLTDSSISQHDDACEVLMRSILQLPDYLDRLISGHRDVPLVLLPLLNDLRAVRGENLLSESAMFTPDTTVDLPAHILQADTRGDMQRQVRELRHRYQLALLGWFRGQNSDASLQALREALETLCGLGGHARIVRLWWVAAGLVDAMIDGSLDGSIALKRVLGQVDREIKRLIDEGESALVDDAREDLFRNLLFYCARSPASVSDRVAEIQATYRLRELLPDEQEMSEARESLSGRNSDLFETVAVAVREELARLKDSLDIVLRNGCQDGRELQPLIDSLRRLGDTLGMLGLGAARKAVVTKAEDMQGSVDAGSAPVDTVLMDVASTLLLVESSVDNMGAGRAIAEDEGQAEAQLAKNEYQHVMDVVIKEAVADLIRAKDAIISYTESEHDVSLIGEVPQWFNQVKGGMLLLGETRPAALVQSIARYISAELIDAGKQASQEELDALADAVCGLEYYLESRQEHRMYGGSAMTAAEQGVDRLGYPAERNTPGEDVPEDAALMDADTGIDEQPAIAEAIEEWSGQPEEKSESGEETEAGAFEFDFSLLDDELTGELERECIDTTDPEKLDTTGSEFSEEQALAPDNADEAVTGCSQDSAGEDAPVQHADAAADSNQVDAGEEDGLAIIGADVDDEILEIFIEEAEEELSSLNEQLPVWLADSDNGDALGTMRRSWHTLKGSGRLVGAMRIGEFAWAFENMLNRVIDGTISVSPVMKTLLQAAVDTLPELVAQIKDSGAPTHKSVARLMRHADALSQGVEFSESGVDAGGDATAVAASEEQPAEVLVERLSDSEAVMLPIDETLQDQVPEPENDLSEESGVDAPACEAGEMPPADEGEPLHGSGVMDPQLFDIFNAESRTHLEVVRQFLDRVTEGEVDIDEPLVRALHTLHGSAHMADADAIAELAGAQEKLLKNLMESGLKADDAVCRALEDTVTVIEGRLSSLPQGSAVEDNYNEVLERVLELFIAIPVSGQKHGSGFSAECADDETFDSPESSDNAVEPFVVGLLSDVDPEQVSPDLPEMQETPELPEAVQQAEVMEEQQPEVAEETPTDGDHFEDHVARDDEQPEILEEQQPEVAEETSTDGDHFEDYATQDDEQHEIPEEQQPEVAEETPTDGDHFEYHAAQDDELIEIFLEEAAENLETADAALNSWRASSDDSDALAELQRALHTLKGGARMADLPAIGDVAHAVESLIIAISENRAVNAASSIDSVQQAQDCLAGMLDRVRNHQPLEPAGWVIDLLNAQREQSVAPAHDGHDEQPQETPVYESEAQQSVNQTDPYAEVDVELLEVFIEEAGDIMEHCEQTLQSWKRDRENQELMAELQRELHTLKGGARMSDITEIGDLAHAVESLMVKVTAGEAAASNSLFNVLERAQDRLAGMVEQVRGRRPLSAAVDIIGALEKLQDGHEPASQDAHAPDNAENAGVALVADRECQERRAKPRTNQELVRVKADLLDNMVNYAGEVSIYRSRLEQQIGAYSFNLVEMEQTVARVREQLRKLEIETEAQVLYRYEREGEMLDEAADSEDFDPLEMDRYSHMQQLSRSLMESVSDLSSIQNLLENITRESETLLLQQSRVNTELQEGLMRTRMVPFLGLAARMRRIVRQTAQELGKKAELELSGAEGEMDRTVVDRIVAPLEHMLRNAISHGIESPEQRLAKGKPEAGTIRITLERESSDVLLRIADDGAGINLDAIRRKAIQRGLMESDSDLSDTEILQFILETGFSTAEKVTQVAGRGVGMDVVNSEVKQLGGSLHIDSGQGRGTVFTIRLPFTLALNQALMIEVGEDTYAIPLSSIEGIVRMRREDLRSHYDNPEARFEYGGYAYEVRHLGTVLGTGTPHLDSGPKRWPVLLARFGEHCVAFHVENLLGSREIVVKSVGPQISTVPGVSGATILGDGRVVMILEIAALLRGGAMSALDRVGETGSRPARTRGLTVMVVDDSITVRKVTTRILERNDMHVIAAKDGVDAVSKLQENIPDIMLLDIEMPRMDGFELATHVRNEARLRDIPIIMITSRTGDKHRQRAMQIGVNRYLGKPFQESDLLENIQALLEEYAVDG